MTLDQLRVFVCVAEQEHVTRAAAELHLTQSAVSATIAALESRYTTKLFDRIGRRIFLTDIGRTFLEEARAVLARATAAELVLADLAGLKRGELRIVASQTVGNYWLPEKIDKFRKLYPAVSVLMEMGNTETVTRKVLKGGVNLGFVEGEVFGEQLLVTPVATDELILVTHSAHPWAKAEAISDHELREATWVLREAGSGTRAAFNMLLKSKRLSVDDLKVIMEMPTNESVLSAVAVAGGATVISKKAAASAIRGGDLAQIGEIVKRRDFYMVQDKERYRTTSEAEFARMVKESAACI